MISFFCPGIPSAQGSKEFKGIRGGRAIMLDTDKNLKSWRAVVAHSCTIEAPLNCPIRLEVVFYFPRPKNHYGSRKGERYLKPCAPKYKASAKDLDKLIRAVGDALTGVAFHDDSLVVELQAAKVYTEQQAGAHITLIPLDK